MFSLYEQIPQLNCVQEMYWGNAFSNILLSRQVTPQQQNTQKQNY